MDVIPVKISSVVAPRFMWLIVAISSLYLMGKYVPISGTYMMESRANAGKVLSYIFIALCSFTYIASTFSKNNSHTALFIAEGVSVNNKMHRYEVIRKIVVTKTFFESNIKIYFHDGGAVELNKMAISKNKLLEIKKVITNTDVNFVLK